MPRDGCLLGEDCPPSREGCLTRAHACLVGITTDLQEWYQKTAQSPLQLVNEWLTTLGNKSRLADCAGETLASSLKGPDAIASACELVWDKLLHAPVNARSSIPLLRVLLCLPSVLWRLGITETTTMTYARRALQAASHHSKDGQLTLVQFQSAVVGMIDDLLATQRRCQMYRRWALRCLFTLVIMGIWGAAFRAAAPVVLLAALILGPMAGILVMLEMDETAKLRTLWRPAASISAPLAHGPTRHSLSPQTATVPLNDGLASELVELLVTPFDVRVASGNEEDEERLMTLISGLRGDELFRAMESSDLMRADTHACLKNDVSSDLVALGHEQLSVTPSILSTSQLTREVISPRMSRASPGILSPKMSIITCSTQGPYTRTSMSLVHNARASPTPPTMVSLATHTSSPRAVPPGPTKLSLEGSDTPETTPRAQNNTDVCPDLGIMDTFPHLTGDTCSLSTRPSGTLDSILHRLARNRASNGGPAPPPDSHRLSRKAQRAADKARKAAAAEARQVLGWRVGGRQGEPTGKLLNRPGVPGLSFQEYLPPTDSTSPGPSLTPYHPDNDDDDDEEDYDFDIPGNSLDLPYGPTMIQQVNPQPPLSLLSAGRSMPGAVTNAGGIRSKGTSTDSVGGTRNGCASAPMQAQPQKQQQLQQHKALAIRLKHKLGLLVNKLNEKRSLTGSAAGSKSGSAVPLSVVQPSEGLKGMWDTTSGARNSWEGMVLGSKGSVDVSKVNSQPGGWWERLRKSGGTQPSTPGSRIGTTLARSLEEQRAPLQVCVASDIPGLEGTPSGHHNPSSTASTTTTDPTASKAEVVPADAPHKSKGKLLGKFSKALQRLKM